MMRPLKVAFIAPREESRTRNDAVSQSLVTRLTSRGAMNATFVGHANNRPRPIDERSPPHPNRLLKTVVAQAARLCFSTRIASRRAAYSMFFNRLLILSPPRRGARGQVENRPSTTLP